MFKLTHAQFQALSNRDKCIKMWKYLARTGSKRKLDFFEECIIDYKPDGNYKGCYACVNARNTCENCPVKWHTNNKNPYCMDSQSPYYSWADERVTERRKFYAQEVLIKVVKTWKK